MIFVYPICSTEARFLETIMIHDVNFIHNSLEFFCSQPLRYLGGTKAYLKYVFVIWKKGCMVMVIHIPAVQTSLD